MRRLFAVLLALVVILLAFLAWKGRGTDRRAVTRSSGEELSRAERLLPSATNDGSGERSASRRSSTEESSSTAPISSAATGRSIRLCVLRSLDRSPLVGVQVSLALRGRKAAPGSLAATTDAEGRALFDLSASDWVLGELAQARAVRSQESEFFHASEDECKLFEGPVRLQEEMVVLGCDCTELRGRFVSTGEAAWRAVGVQAFEPRRGAMSCAVFLGRARATPWNSFVIPVCPRRATPLVELEIALPSGSCTRLVPWSELVSEAGAAILIETSELRIRVLDEGGRPLAGAEVRATALPRGSPLPTVLETREDGEASVTLPAGPFAVCAGKPGYAAAFERGTLEPGSRAELGLRLRALTQADVIEGRVLSAAGSPVPHAFVTAAPVVSDDELAMAGVVQVTSDELGRFRLAIDFERELSLVASARGYGLSDELVFQPDGRPVELVIHAQGKLVVRIEAPEIETFENGLIEYALVERTRASVESGHEFGLPLELSEIPEGDYDVFVLVPGWSAWAQGSARVQDGATSAIVLAARSTHWARGRLLRPDGTPSAGTRLVPDVPGWPAPLSQLWSTTTAPDGSFELVLGAANSAGVTPIENGHALESLLLNAGDGQTLVLR